MLALKELSVGLHQSLVCHQHDTKYQIFFDTIDLFKLKSHKHIHTEY